MATGFRPKRFPMSPEDYNLDVRIRHIEDALTGLGGSAINFNTLVNSGSIQSNGTVTPSSGGGSGGGGGGITMLHGDVTGPAANTVVVSAAGNFDILNGVETITFTDTGGGADLPALRPSFLKLIHHTTAVTVPGVGERLDYVVADNAGTDQQIASQIGEITAVAAGAVDGTIGWEVMHTSNLCEVARCRASTGLAATAATAFDGFIGGEMWVRGNFYAGASGEGTAGIGQQAVSGTKLTITATADADKGLVIKPKSSTQTGSALICQDSSGNGALEVTMDTGMDAMVHIRQFGNGALRGLQVTGAVADSGGNDFVRFEDGSGIPVLSCISPGGGDAVIARNNNVSDGVFLFRAKTGQTADIAHAQILTTDVWRLTAAGDEVYQRASSTGTSRQVTSIISDFLDNTDASRKGRGRLYAADAASTTRLAVEWSTDGSNPKIGFLGATAVVRPSAYTLSGSATRTFPTDPSVAYTGIDNAQPGTVYATVADLNTLRTAVSTLIGVVRQGWTDLGSSSGYGLLNA